MDKKLQTYVTPAEAMEILKLCRKTIARQMKAGKIPFEKYGTAYRIPINEEGKIGWLGQAKEPDLNSTSLESGKLDGLRREEANALARIRRIARQRKRS